MMGMQMYQLCGLTLGLHESYLLSPHTLSISSCVLLRGGSSVVFPFFESFFLVFHLVCIGTEERKDAYDKKRCKGFFNV